MSGPADSAFDLSETFVHLGLGSSAVPVPDFEWTPEFLERYSKQFASDRDEGRLVMIGASKNTWTYWERHPAGEELVVVLSGKLVLFQEIDGSTRSVPMKSGEAMVNPRGVWHTVDVRKPGRCLFVTPGRGTEHRPR
jgi:mannose-6-phosphate isomerase-like protein (cupin superfamily)